MNYRFFSDDFNIPGSFSFKKIQGFDVPCFDSFFWFMRPPFKNSFGSLHVSHSSSLNRFFKCRDVLFFADFGKLRFIPYVAKKSSFFSFGFSNVGAFYPVFFFSDGSTSVAPFFGYDLDNILLKTADFFIDNDFIVGVDVYRVVSFSYVDKNKEYCSAYYNCLFEQTFGPLVYPECCYPDFSPIVRILGGTPSPVQLENLKSICYLLGVNTAKNGLKDCDLMKEYLKRLNQILGGSPYSEPNDNLKSICYLLGVDNSENGLKDCELSKDYVKRNSKMLGAE